MYITDKLLKPVLETKYLAEINADRYRAIIRYFYLQDQKLKHWIYQEELYEELIQHDYFKQIGYTMTQCQQDLNQLVEWKNLYAVQDTKKVSSIEAFKNRKYQYQLTECSVEIERMILRIENLSLEGASLEPTLIERIRKGFVQISKLDKEEPEKVYGWWRELVKDFKQLDHDYHDYMRELNSVKAEEMMKTTEFLLYKDNIIKYLRNFVKSLQYHVTAIEEILKKVDFQQKKCIIDKIVAHELSIPRFEQEISQDIILDNVAGTWNNIYQWFVSDDGREAEYLKIFDMANEIIRKITRYATQISGMSHTGANRKEEYYKVLSLFHKMKDIQECHRLSAYVFGIEKTFHLKGEMIRETESINSGVFEEKPTVITIGPRIRTYRERGHRSGIVDHSEEKEKARQQLLEQAQREKELIRSYIVDGKLEFARLPIIEQEVRDTFLVWLSKALERKDRTAKTQDGLTYHVIEDKEGKRCRVECTDGVFEMPAYSIVFEEGEEA